MGLRSKLASEAALIFAMRIAGAGLVFLAQAAIARFWGAGYLGEFLLIVAAVNLLAVAMPLGFQSVGVYFASEYRARGEGRRLWAFMAHAYGHILLVLLGLVLAGPHVLPLLGEPGRVLALYWHPACLLTLATSLVYVNGALLVGLKRPFAGFFADTLFRPMILAAAFALGLAFGNPSDGFAAMLWTMSLGYAAIAVIHLGFVLAATRTMSMVGAAPRGEWRRWWRFAMPWVLISFATDFFFDIDLLLLSGHLSREDLAIFGVCSRVFSLVSFGVGAVYAITMPDMFEAEAMSNRRGFHQKVGDANLVAGAISLLLFILVLLGSPLLLALFGPGFEAGAMPLAILCLALVVRSAFGPASMVLSIHDRPYASLPGIALGLGTLVVGNMALVPEMGLAGAALAALLAIILWNAALWLTALHYTKLDVSVLPRLRLLIGRATAGSAA